MNPNENNKYKTAREAYYNLRKKQKESIRKDIQTLIKEEKWNTPICHIANGGYGSSKYTSGGNIPEFDLSYWLWLSVYDYKKKNRTNKEANIYFQSNDVDPNGERNTHWLIDRISFEYVGRSIKRNIRTKYDLPLDDDTREGLIADFYKFVKSCEKDDDFSV